MSDVKIFSICSLLADNEIVRILDIGAMDTVINWRQRIWNTCLSNHHD